MVEEYYVRPPDSDTARGPFDIRKLQTLAEAGQVTKETLYYDDDFQSWAAIGSNEDLLEKIFPSKRKLQLKPVDKQGKPSTTEKDEASHPDSVKVDEMLAAAEGYTEETKHVRDLMKSRQRAAALSTPALTLIFLISALTFVYPSWPTIQMAIAGEWEAFRGELLRHPVMFIGLFDVLLTVLLLLSVTQIFPLLRFRAVLGAGFLAFLYWSQGVVGDINGYLSALGMILFAVGTYICTLTLNFRAMVLGATCGLVGVAGHAYFQTIAPLVKDYLANR